MMGYMGRPGYPDKIIFHIVHVATLNLAETDSL